MRNFKKVVAAVLSAAMITTCTPILTPSVSYAAGSTDYTSATDAALNQVHIVSLKGPDAVTGEDDYVWYKFNASPETEIELTITRLEGGTVWYNLYDSSLKELYADYDNRTKTLTLGKDNTYYIRFFLHFAETSKASFMVKGSDAVAPTIEPTVAPTAEPTIEPTPVPTVQPTIEPTPVPTVQPTVEPTPVPTVQPTVEPTPVPTVQPTVEPTPVPTVQPTTAPTANPGIGNVDSDFWNEDNNTGSGVYDNELPVPEIKEVANNGKYINIVWSCSDKSDIDGYYIYRSNDGQNWNKIATINDTEIEDYEDTDVSNGEGYGYIIRSYVNDSESENSIPEYTCFLNKVNVKSVKSKASKKLTIKWSTNSKASGYQIRISTTKSFTKTTTELKKVSSTSKSTKTISKLKGGKKYYVQIRAYRSYNGEIYYTEWSNSKSLKVKR